MFGMFTWKPEYSVHIGTIDAQHQSLLAIGDELHVAMTTGQGQAKMGKILNRLIQYTASHFAHEERLMQKHGYPDFAAHKAEHDTLVAKVTKFEADFKAGHIGMSIEVLEFLKDWLVGHIQGSDRKYVACLTQNKVA